MATINKSQQRLRKENDYENQLVLPDSPTNQENQLVALMKTYKLFNFKNPVRQARRDSQQVSLRTNG
jgi:hypothetical protein